MAEYAMRPEVDDAALKKKKAEYSLLALLGFGVCKGGGFHPNTFPKDEETMLNALNRLSKVDGETRMEELQAAVPEGPLEAFNEEAAEQVASEYKKVSQGAGMNGQPFAGCAEVYSSEALVSPLRQVSSGGRDHAGEPGAVTRNLAASAFQLGPLPKSARRLATAF